MAIVPLRLSEDDVRALDVLVKSGLYKNRSEAARALIRRGAKVDLGGVSKVTETVKRLLAARRKRGRLFTIVYPTKTATQLVAEGRGR